MKRKVKWTKFALESLENYCTYIRKDSPKSADKVRSEILKTARKFEKFPNSYQVDDLYPNNPGSIRRFFKFNYRVVFQVRENDIIILNIYHTSQNP